MNSLRRSHPLYNIPRERIHLTMNISYDRTTDSLYVHLTEQVGCNAGELESGVVFDFDASGALVGVDIQHASRRGDFNQPTVACGYRADEDLFHIRLSNKKIVREASLDWHCITSYASDDTIVEIVLLDAKKSGALSLSYQQTT